MRSASHDFIQKINRFRLPSILVLVMIFSAIVPSSLFAAETMTAEDAQELRTRFVEEAKSYLGAPYRLAGISPDGFDCSGFVRYVAARVAGINLPRTAQGMYGFARGVSVSKREVGDLVFFKEASQTGNSNDVVSHVGIYLGGDEFIHAASEGPETGVIISSLKERYWLNGYCGTGRILPSAASGGKFEGNTDMDANIAASETMFVSEPMTVNKFFNNFALEANVTANWAFANASPDYYMNFRGITGTIFSSYNFNNIVGLGLGLMFRYNAGTRAFQLPLIVGINATDYFRIYGGPMFLFGDNYAPGTDILLDTSSGMAGIFGLAVRTPALKIGPVEARLVQEVNYSTYAAKPGTGLSGRDLALSGLEFSTGISIALPFRVFAK